MEFLLRPFRRTGWVALAGFGVCLLTAPVQAPAQFHHLVAVIESSNPFGTHEGQGYLGIDTANVNAEKASALKLKEARGAVITLIDHDAPAGQVGLKVNDVVLQLDGQNISDAEQFRRLLKECPPGRKVTLQISRDGNLQSVTAELVDRKTMEKTVWSKLGSVSSIPEMGFLSGDSTPSGFHLPSFGSTLKVGALVEPLTSQMAEYLGVQSGLMVKQVARRSAAEYAGFRAFDVILKVGTESIATSADWSRALRANQGKPVPVVILRDKKQQTLTLQVDSKHHMG
jgi:serine protease Do